MSAKDHPNADARCKFKSVARAFVCEMCGDRWDAEAEHEELVTALREALEEFSALAANPHIGDCVEDAGIRDYCNCVVARARCQRDEIESVLTGQR